MSNDKHFTLKLLANNEKYESRPVLDVASAAGQKPRWLDQVRDRLQVKHYSLRTGQAYVDWIKRFILCWGKTLSGRQGGYGSRRILDLFGSGSESGVCLPESDIGDAVMPILGKRRLEPAMALVTSSSHRFQLR